MRARELRQQVALVPQRTTVFSGTIADAIRFGRRASDDEVLEAARLANADDFIRALPQGYDTQLCLLYTSPSPRDGLLSRMPSSA